MSSQKCNKVLIKPFRTSSAPVFPLYLPSLVWWLSLYLIHCQEQAILGSQPWISNHKGGPTLHLIPTLKLSLPSSLGQLKPVINFSPLAQLSEAEQAYILFPLPPTHLFSPRVRCLTSNCPLAKLLRQTEVDRWNNYLESSVNGKQNRKTTKGSSS